MSGEQLANTASITLITGLPGSGKTLRIVQFCKDAFDAGEVVFTCNVNGLKLPSVPFEDPRKWRDIPAGSILVVDEAQQFFRTRRGGEAPEYLTAMETIRHHGVRLIIATQQPDYLDAHLRGLVGLHEHLVRLDGKPSAKIFRHGEVMDNVRSEKARSRYDSEVWPYPSDLYALYQSAEVHTVKKVYSSRFKRGLKIGIAALVVAGFTGYQMKQKFFGGAAKDTPIELVSGGGDAAGSPARMVTKPTSLEMHGIDARTEYLARYAPRFAEMPWSMPALDQREAVAQPQVMCMSSGKTHSKSCTCMTEQGTIYKMPIDRCILVARHGMPYNPFKNASQPSEVAKETAPTTSQEAPQARSATGIGNASPEGQQARYGGFRDTAPSTSP